MASVWLLAWVLARSSRNGRTSSWRLISSAATAVTVRAAEPTRICLIFAGALFSICSISSWTPLAANLVARGRYRSERDRSAPSERVAIAACYAYLPGDRDALVDQCRNDARGQHIGQADDKIGTFVRGALGDLGTDAVAVGSGIPFAGVDDFDLDIGVQGERLMNAKDAQGELHKCCSADDDNMVRAAGDGKFGNDATWASLSAAT